MDMGAIITSVISGVFALIIAIVEYRRGKNDKFNEKIRREEMLIAEERKKEAEIHAKQRTKENLLSMKLQITAIDLGLANATLSSAVGEALQTGVANGNITSAKEKVKIAEDKAKTSLQEYEDFLKKIAIGETTKI